MGILSFVRHSCRRSESHRAFRELIITFGQGGCVVVFALRELDAVLLSARDQLEHDCR